jgi:hypothetical protein
VSGSKAKKGLGANVFVWYFFMVFSNSPRRETPKNLIKQNRGKFGFGGFVVFLVILFQHGPFAKVFVVFLNSHR